MALACSVINKFDDLGEIAPDGGAGSGGTGGSGDGGSAGKGSGGTGNAGNEAGAGGDGGPGEPLVGAIVVGQRVGTGTQARNHIVVIDPEDGSEVGRTQTELQVIAIGYEAPRDKWFIFTGTTGPGGPSTVLVGSVDRRGFVKESETEVVDGKPSGQNTLTVLNQRIFYRTVQSNGTSTSDKLVLLDTSNLSQLTIRGTVDLPPDQRLIGTLGRPSPTAAGGRVTFLHFNPFGACETIDGGTGEICPVRTSTILIGATVTNPAPPVNLVEIDKVAKSGSLASGATDIRPNGFDYFAFPPDPTEGTIGTVYKYDTSSNRQAAVPFDLGAIDSANSVSMSATLIDPCVERVYATEQANTRRLYVIPLAQGAMPTSLPLNAPAGGLAYEPYTKTIVQFFQDPQNPSFRGFQIGGTATQPEILERGTAGQAPWRPPTDLNPAVVVTKTPLQAPCN